MNKTMKTIEFVATDGKKVTVDLNDRWAMYKTFGACTEKKFSPEALIEWADNQLEFLRNCIVNVKAAKKVAEMTYVKSLTREQLQGILELMADNSEPNP
jgi:hypothetical protein